MGAPTGTPVSAYPTAGQVMNRARAIVNDAYKQGQGLILTNTAPFTTEFLNAALEELQDRMGNAAAEIVLTWDNIILTPILPVAINPATQIFISYEGFFDGTTMHESPSLPTNIISVKKLEERITESGQPFLDMGQPMENLPSVNQSAYLNYWEYRGDRIYMIGSTSTEDLRLRGEIRQMPIAAADAPTLNNVQISILASINAMACIVAWHYAKARGAKAAQIMQSEKEYFIKQIRRRYSRRAQGIQYQRRFYGQGGDFRNIRLPW